MADTARMYTRTIYRLYNESAFYQIAVDNDRLDSLVACLDSAVVRFNVKRQTIQRYVGMPDERGYREGVGVGARFRTCVDMAQTTDALIVSDRDNWCLRLVNRTSVTTSTLLGRCEEQRLSTLGSEDENANNVRLTSAGALALTANKLYFVDGMDLRLLNLDTGLVRNLGTAPQSIQGLTLLDGNLLATVNHGLMNISISDEHRVDGDFLVGGDFPGDDSGSLTMTAFNQPMGVTEVTERVYLVVDHINSHLKLIDFKR